MRCFQKMSVVTAHLICNRTWYTGDHRSKTCIHLLLTWYTLSPLHPGCLAWRFGYIWRVSTCTSAAVQMQNEACLCTSSLSTNRYHVYCIYKNVYITHALSLYACIYDMYIIWSIIYIIYTWLNHTKNYQLGDADSASLLAPPFPLPSYSTASPKVQGTTLTALRTSRTQQSCVSYIEINKNLQIAPNPDMYVFLHIFRHLYI